MSHTVVFKVVLGQQRDVPRPVPAPPTVAPKRRPRPVVAVRADAQPTSRIARLLALAYVLRDAVESGAIKDYREAGRRLGLCHPQVTHVMNLLHLAATIQERLLLGQLVVSEHALRPVCRVTVWQAQERTLGP